MGKIAFVLAIAGLLVLPPAVASAGGKPTRTPLSDTGTFDFPAGVACSFELAGQPVANNVTLKTFPPDGNGAVVEIFNGTLKDELTNLATGRSIVVNVSGPAKVINYPDGSATASYGGHSLLFFFATDIPAGPAAYLFSGRVVANYTPSGQQTIVSASGTREDICAALS